MSRWIKCDAIDKENIPKNPGVYCIYFQNIQMLKSGKKHKIIYIGSSSKIRYRLEFYGFQLMYSNWSYKSKFGIGNFFIKYKISKKYGDWLMDEVRLIRKIQPKFNKQRLK